MAFLFEINQKLCHAFDFGFSHVRRIDDVLLATLLEINRGIGEGRSEVVLHGGPPTELTIKQSLPTVQVFANLCVVICQGVGIRDVGDRVDFAFVANGVGTGLLVSINAEQFVPVFDPRGFDGQ